MEASRPDMDTSSSCSRVLPPPTWTLTALHFLKARDGSGETLSILFKRKNLITCEMFGDSRATFLIGKQPNVYYFGECSVHYSCVLHANTYIHSAHLHNIRYIISCIAHFNIEARNKIYTTGTAGGTLHGDKHVYDLSRRVGIIYRFPLLAR